MLGRLRNRLGMAAVLVALCFAASAAASVPSGRLSTRHAGVIAHFDSIVGRSSADSVWGWVTAIERHGPTDPGFHLVTGLMRARLLVLRGSHDEARPLAQTALDRARITRDTLLECDALYVMGISHALAGETVAALPLARRLRQLARAARLPRDEAQAHLTLAYLDLLANRFAAAERGYRAALRAYSPALDRIPRRIARVGLARACFQQGRVEEARRLDIELIRESRELDDPVNEAVALNNLAVHELLAGDPADALPSYRRALAIQRRLGRWHDATTTAANLASALARLRRLDDAVEVLESVGDTARAGVRAWQRAELVSQLAYIRGEQGRYDQAESLALRAWALCDSARIRPGRQLAVTRAKLMAERGRADAAVALLDRWIEGIPRDEPDPDDELIARAAAGQVLVTSGRPHEALARWSDVRSRIDTTAAIGHVKLGYALIGESIAAFGARDVPRARARFHAAVREWERGRLGFRSAQWRELLEVEGMRTWGAAAGGVLTPLPGERAETRLREGFDLLQRIKARTLGERMARGASRPADAEALQRRVLREGELALDLFPAYDSVLVFAVTPRAMRLVVLQDGPGLRRRIARFGELARDPAPASVVLREGAARSLSLDLLGPVADLVATADRLIVSGGGLVDDLPWALLPEPGTGRPLIDRLDVSSVPSLSALARLRSGNAAAAGHGPLVVAGPNGPDGRVLTGVEQEVDFLRGRYSTAEVRAPRSGAEIRGALAAMSGVGAIHVAAHFADDPEDPWHTGILLGDARRDESWVRPAALAAIRVRARLVTLAGCSSAGAHAPALHGERGLATAFLAAGAGSVLGTLWPVEDRASVDLVQRFYRALDEGHEAARALALAQSGMRTSAGGRDASRWAGFVLLGDPAVRVRLPRRAGLDLPGLDRPRSGSR